MTISTKSDPPAPHAPTPAAVIERPTARNVKPEPVIASATAHAADPKLASAQVKFPAELESRIELRRAELIGRLGELRADTHLAAVEARDLLKAKLSELAHIIKRGVVDHWTNLSDTVTHELEHWLDASRRALTNQSSPVKQASSAQEGQS